jgi:hypothetical protein
MTTNTEQIDTAIVVVEHTLEELKIYRDELLREDITEQGPLPDVAPSERTWATSDLAAAKGKDRHEFKVGDIVQLTPGTAVHGKHPGNNDKDEYWHAVVEEGLDVTGKIISQVGPHATMNGGGWDWTLEDVIGERFSTRTTFARDEHKTFIYRGTRWVYPTGEVLP